MSVEDISKKAILSEFSHILFWDTDIKNLKAEEIGNAAAFLLSEQASAITGVTLYVDNGMHAMGVAVDSPALTTEKEEALA